jgi:CubicO group peptidase (beta-lactamase class C family)
MRCQYWLCRLLRGWYLSLAAARCHRTAPRDDPANCVGRCRTRYEYSNAGYAIAGAMVERALGVPWEDALAGGVYAPLGMATAGFGPPDARGGVVDGSVACGHAASGEPEPVRDNPDAIAPAGKACASLADWAKFVAVHLAAAAAGGSGGGCGPGHDADACAALAGLDFRRLHTPPSRASDADEVTYAMGWNATSRTWARGGSGTGRVLTHSGSNTYWYCVAWLAPELGFGVLAASNQGGEDAARACDEAAAALIRDHLAALKATRLE